MASSCCSSAPNIFCRLALSAKPPGCKTPLRKLNSSGEGPLPRLRLLEFSQVYQVSLCPWWASKGEHTHTHKHMVANINPIYRSLHCKDNRGLRQTIPNDFKHRIQTPGPLPKLEKSCNLTCQDTRQVDRTCHRQKAYHETGLAANLAQSLRHAAVLPIQLLPFRIFRIESWKLRKYLESIK